MKGPQSDPVSHPVPGRTAVPHATRQIRAEPRDLSASLQASTRFMAIGITTERRTVIDGVNADMTSPIMNQLTIIVN